jgi:uncharacterized delta-60 repeat protein
MLRQVLLVSLGLVVPGLAGAQDSSLAAGTLDPTFGAGGKVLTDFGGTPDFASAIAVQRDGRIVAAGSSFRDGSADFAVARYNPDGSLDASFGDSGMVVTDFGGFDLGLAVAVQRDGKIVVAGSSQQPGTGDLALARYDKDGSLDATFGTGGMVLTDLGGFDQANAIAIQADGKIVVAGYSNAHGSYDFALIRYDGLGRLDATFGTQGALLVDFDGPNDNAAAIAIQRDGKIVVAGASNGGSTVRFALARCDGHGILDPAFGIGGRVLTEFEGFAGASGVAIQWNGKIVVAGTTNGASSSDFALARYHKDGTLDLRFGRDGKVVTDVGGDDGATAVAIQRDGRIIASGISIAAPPFGPGDFALTRYRRDGTLDKSFGMDGIVLTPFGGSGGFAYALRLQRNGKIVVAGVSNAAGSSDFALARYLNH